MNNRRLSRTLASSLACTSSSTSKRANDQFKGARQGDFKSVFMCIDMGCFLVSFGIRSKPHLKGKPIAVRMTHSEGERPAFGGLNGTSSNGMCLGEAQKRCPDLEVISYSFEEHQKVSKILYDTVAEYTLSIEAVGCDELYADLTELVREMSLHAIGLSDIVASIQADIKQRTKCPVSAGIGPNMLAARLATRMAKSDGGQFIVRPEEVENFMRQQKMKDIPGVCPAILKKLEPFGIELCEELLCYSLSDLQKEFGAKFGQLLFNASRGKDERTIKDESIRKSTSCDVNGVGPATLEKLESFGIEVCEELLCYTLSFLQKEFGAKAGQLLFNASRGKDERSIKDETEAEVSTFLDSLAAQMESRMLNSNVKRRHLTLKLLICAKCAPVETPKFLGCGQCDARNHSTLLPAATNNSRILAFECKKLFRNIAPVITDVRGVGMSLLKLESQLTAKRTSEVGRIDGFFASKSDVGLGKSTTTPSLSAQPSTSAVGANSAQSASKKSDVGKTTPSLGAQPTASTTVASKSAQQALVPDVGLGKGKATPCLSALSSASRVANRSAQQSSRLGDFRRDLFRARGAQKNSAAKAVSATRNEPDFSAACRPTTSTGAATFSKAPPPSVSSKADIKKKKDDYVNDEAKNYVQVIRTLFSDLRSMELPRSINDLDPEVLKVLTLEMREVIKSEIAERADMALRVEKQRVERTNFTRGIFGVSTPSRKVVPTIPGGAIPTAAEYAKSLNWQLELLAYYRTGAAGNLVVASAAELALREGLARIGFVGGGGGGGPVVFPPAMTAIILAIPGQLTVINGRIDAVKGQLVAMRREVAIARNLACGDGLSTPYVVVANAAGFPPTVPGPLGMNLPPLRNRDDIVALNAGQRIAYLGFYGLGIPLTVLERRQRIADEIGANVHFR